MSKRTALPGAEELFRRTSAPTRPAGAPATQSPAPATGIATDVADDSLASNAIEGGVRPVTTSRRRRGSSRPTGRIRHDEKITVYVSPEELLELEHARLALRGTHGLAVDRGRIVREAIAVVVADLEARGAESVIVRRLTGL